MTAQRRHEAGADILRGCMLTHIDQTGIRWAVMDREADWFATLADIFGLTLIDVESARKQALLRRVYSSHLAWETAHRANAGHS